MQITYYKNGEFKIRTKSGVIHTADTCKINDFVIPGDGEYEVSGIRAQCISKILFFNAENYSIAYLDKRKKPLSDQELEKIEGVDILFIPVGGGEVYDSKEALNIIKETEPKIVIPMHYKDISDFKKLEGVSPETLDELKLKGEISEDQSRRIIILNEKNK